MKKIFYTIAFFVILGVASLHAQTPVPPPLKGFYMSVQGGYNLPMFRSNVGFFGMSVTGIQNQKNSEIEDTKISFGEGANAGIGIGYLFEENFGAELQVNYLMGSTTKTTQSNDGAKSFAVDQEISARMIQASPLFVMKADLKKLTPYAKIGAVIGFSPDIKYEEVAVTTPVAVQLFQTTHLRESSQETKGKTTIGFTGSFGVDYELSRNMSLFTEIRAVGLNYSPEKATLTKYHVDGVDQLGTLNTYHKETEFKDNPASSTDLTQPRQVEKIKLPFSSIGLNLGFRYTF